MSEGDNDRKRRASELDATVVVAPKKKFLAAQAEAAEKAQESTPAKAHASSSAAAAKVKPEKETVKLEKGDVHSTSYSIRDNAPAGAHADDSEEVLRFQNQQLFAALQASRSENQRLEQQVEGLKAERGREQAAVACVYRHWSVLTEELKSTFLRLEHSPSDLDTAPHHKMFESLVGLQGLVPEKADGTLAASCKVAQELMQEVVQSVMDVTARQQRVLSAMQDKAKGGSMEAEMTRASKQSAAAEKALGELQSKFAAYTLEEGRKADAAAAKAALVDGLRGEVEGLKGQLEATERRLVRSEENFRLLKEAAPPAQSAAGGGGAAVKTEGGGGEGGGGGSEAERQLADLRHQAETRLEEVKTLQQEVTRLRDEGSKPAAEAEVSESAVVASHPYTSLLEQLRQTKRECEAFHAPKIAQLTAELAEGKERVFDERQKLEQQHYSQVRAVQARLSQLTSQLLEAKQEARSLQFKLDQKSAGEISSKRAEELSEMLTKLQDEYKRLRTEHDALRQKPDAEELRREFREREEKIAKERDIKQIEASDYMEQIRAQERKIAMLMQDRKGEGPANGVNGAESVQAKELEALKKEVEGLRNDKKDLQRRLQKADRGFNDCNKLYQQVKKEKDGIMRDLESLGMSFEEMQEQNMRLLQNMKQRDEEQNELLRQRMKDKQQREMLLEEKSALKLKLEKAEELVKARDDAVDKCKVDMEQQRQELLKRQKEEELGAAIVVEHRKLLQQRELAAKEAKREADKVRQTLAEQQKEQKEKLQALQDMQFDNNRLQEELASARRSLSHNERSKGQGLDSQQLQLLQHYRSRVKCHCGQGDKARVLPCGHASCIKCTESLIKERSRKCPACSKKFDQAEIRPLFLQGSTDEG